MLDSGAVGLIFKVPPEDPRHASTARRSRSARNIDELVARSHRHQRDLHRIGDELHDAAEPDRPVDAANRGAKIMVYHGVSDPIFSVNDTTAWYDGAGSGATAATRPTSRASSACPAWATARGGPATDQFDMIYAAGGLGRAGQGARQHRGARARGAGNAGGVNPEVPATWAADRTRPLCPYPEIARYRGFGDVELASSYSCR